MNLRNLYLIGMMGTGKSAVGKITADVLGLNFIDSDQFIENQFGLKVSEILQKRRTIFADWKWTSSRMDTPQKIPLYPVAVASALLMA